jgi:hypothetical protein
MILGMKLALCTGVAMKLGAFVHQVFDIDIDISDHCWCFAFIVFILFAFGIWTMIRK